MKTQGSCLLWLWLGLFGTQALNMGQLDAELAWGWQEVLPSQVYPNDSKGMDWSSMHPSAVLQEVS